ncbi:MAG: hypothetical protein A2219_00855 [Elusimicrobia bacterium RIFOXYA2_FULL_50_26]|nr:MAG: hypothetical protein A2219_00855 [Elusimicrobia bacterium RIFOXYA2_FULL_50_26]
MNINTFFTMTHTRALILLAAVAAGVYANTLFNSFMWDDHDLITKDPVIQNDAFGAFFSPSYWKDIPQQMRGRLRPVRTLTFLTDHAIYGNRPWGFHATNLLLHTINVLLIYAVCLQLCGSWPAALIGALLFAVHPAHVESVAWIKNRSDMLGAIFILLALLSFLRLEGIKRQLAVTACFAAAVLSKEIAIMLPFILMAAAQGYLPADEKKKAMSWLASLAAAGAGFFLFKEHFWRPEISASSGMAMDAYIQMRAIVATLSEYSNILFTPLALSAERDIDFNNTVSRAVSAGLVFMVIAAIAIFAAAILKRKRLLPETYNTLVTNAVFGYIFMLLAIIPVSNIVFLHGRPLAEQRLYIPSIGYAIIFGNVAAFLISKAAAGKYRALPAAGVAVIIAVFAAQSFARNLVWRNDFTFWSEAVRINPAHYRANYNLGLIYVNRGDVDMAISHFSTAAVDCDRPEVFNYLARCYDARGDYDSSLKNYTTLLNLSPDLSADVYNNIGIVFEKKNDIKNAQIYYEAALAREAGNRPAQLNLARLYEKSGNKARAREIYRRYLVSNAGDGSCSIASANLAKMDGKK